MNGNIIDYINSNPELTEREVQILLEGEYESIKAEAINNRKKELKAKRDSLFLRVKSFLYEITHIQIEVY